MDDISGVDPAYVAAADAATLESPDTHADAGDTANLTASEAYTDSTAAQTRTSAKSYTHSEFAAWNDGFSRYRQQVNKRFAQTDKCISQIDAIGNATPQMPVNAANNNGPNGRVAIGVGVQGGQCAVSVGYGTRIGNRASISVGASLSGGESSAGAGFGSICN
jgi:hypothetical protein